MKYLAVALLALAVIHCFGQPAQAADKVRVGKSIGSLWAFLPPDIGVEKGIFAQYGIDVDISALGSGARLQQALASDSIDIGLSAGADMLATIKGSPVLTVAAFAEEPRSVVIMVGAELADPEARRFQRQAGGDAEPRLSLAMAAVAHGGR